MLKNEIAAKIGRNKLLIYKPDLEKETDEEFINQFRQVADSNPESLQEFFIRLAEVQKQNTSPMNIQLRNLKIYDRLSQETIAFTADLYINGVKAGTAENTGHGGSTDYTPSDPRFRKLINEAENWCVAQPPEILKDVATKGQNITIPVSLENYIDNIVGTQQQKKHLEQFNRKLNKHQQYGIVFGIPDKEYRVIKFPLPLINMLEEPKGIEAVKNVIQNHVLSKLKEGEKILNTNLPEEMLSAERKRTPNTLQQTPAPIKKGKSI